MEQELKVSLMCKNILFAWNEWNKPTALENKMEHSSMI